jgi:SWI/SNF-related matrix-associated actin-dependent regulator 1 of chromatin subfamily A
MAISAAALRATLRLALVERGGAQRLAVDVAGEVPVPAHVLEREALAGAPLRAARVVELVARRLEGTLYHAVSRCFSYALAQHDALVRALARPADFLPPFAQLYDESPLRVAVARGAGESAHAHAAREAAAQRAAHQSEYAQLRAARITVHALAPPLVAHLATAGARLVEDAAAAAALPCPAHVPPPLWDMFFPYQRAGVAFLVARLRALLCDEMGCGKTKQALAAALHFIGASQRPAIIVVPSSLKEQWRREFEEYAAAPAVVARTVDGAPLEVCVPATARGAVSARGVTIVSYDLCARADMHARLMQLGAATLVLDEAHYIKTPAAQRSRAVAALGARATNVLALSGTPAMSRPYELFTQLALVAPRLFFDAHAFGLRYCGAEERAIGGGRVAWEYRGAERLDELNAVLRTLMVRRLKRDILAYLPAKTRERVFVAVDDASKAEVARMRAHAAAVRASGTDLQANAALLAAVRHTAHVKVPAIVRYLDEVVLGPAGGAPPKFLFFAHHHEVLDAVEAHLRSRALRTFRIDGATSEAARDEGVRAFQAGELDAAVLSITAAGVGLTLTRAALVVFGELHWNFSALDQAECRVHRITQTEPVTIRYLVASGTTDEHMWQIVSSKMTRMAALIDGTTEKLEYTNVDGRDLKKLKK